MCVNLWNILKIAAYTTYSFNTLQSDESKMHIKNGNLILKWRKNDEALYSTRHSTVFNLGVSLKDRGPLLSAAVKQHWTLCHLNPKMAWNQYSYTFIYFLIIAMILCQWALYRFTNWPEKSWEKKMPNVDVIYIDVINTFICCKFTMHNVY